jgi:hypothetical protein
MSPVEPAPECGWALEIILEGRDRLSEPETARRLRAHLDDCQDCRRVRTAERRLEQALAGDPLPPAPADFHERVKALVRRQRRLRWWTLAGVVALLAGLGVLLLMQL